ncbi:MAG: tetratricopeptide repeat protein [Chloroflexi bacterium]|nr:tetratricopeptide repeat protein [Chloroflexota bacterium]
MGDYDEARTALNRSLELRPDDPGTLNARGVTRFQLGDTVTALSDFTRACQLTPGEALPQFNKAAALLKLGSQAEAQEALERVIAIDPSFAGASQALQQLRTPARGDWSSWWFSSGSSWRRRVMGTGLLLLLAVYLLYPLVRPDAYIPLPWSGGRFDLNTGQPWQYYIVPVAVLLTLLLLPTIGTWVRRIGPIVLEPRAPEPQTMPELEPRLTRE